MDNTPIDTDTSLEDIQKKYDILNKRYEVLKQEYDNLVKSHDQLKNDYAENTIIQSMNEMKDRYNRLLQTSVPNHKYELINNKYTKMLKYENACSVVLEHVSKLILQVTNNVYSMDTKKLLNKIESEINITRDLLDDRIHYDLA